MPHKVALSMVIIVVSVIAMGTWEPRNASAQTASQTSLLPGKLAIYHGFPSLANGSEGNLTAATDVFNDYDIVIFGDGLQDPGHPDHVNTETIISHLKTPPNHTAVYGYIAIGVTTVNLPMEEIWSRVDAWHAMGIAGIFVDEADYDFGVSRQRQNDAVDYVHRQGLSVFINAFDPEDVFSPAVHSTLNPTAQPTHLGPNDIYLHESFQIILNEFQDSGFWVNKSDKALTYKNEFGTRMATVTTVSPDNPGFDQGKFDYAWWSTLLYGFDAMGWGEPSFSASDNHLPFRTRPDPGDIGSAFTSPVVHDPPAHTRTTTAGTLEVNTAAHIGKFTPALMHVALDIKPGSFPNSINPLSRGKLPVAILTTDTFDASRVAPATVRFGRTGSEAAAVLSDLADVDGDGDTDMILHFNTQDAGILCGDSAGSLTGETLNQRAFEGSDSIKTMECE